MKNYFRIRREEEKIELEDTGQKIIDDSAGEAFNENADAVENSAQPREENAEENSSPPSKIELNDNVGVPEEDANCNVSQTLTLPQRYALSMANNPKAHFYSGFCSTILVSVLAMVFGHLKIGVDNKGWLTRGTKIADGATQAILLNCNRDLLFNGIDSDYAEWDDLLDRDLFNARRKEWKTQPRNDHLNNETKEESLPVEMVDQKQKEKKEAICNGTWFTAPEYFTDPNELNFGSIWQTFDAESKNPTETALSADALYNLCIEEERVLNLLENNDLCYKCPIKENEQISYKCAHPISLVSMARTHISVSSLDFERQSLNPTISCGELKHLWTPEFQADFTSRLRRCTFKFLQHINITTVKGRRIEYHGDFICPLSQFSPFAVDQEFSVSNPSIVKYTASIFPQKNDEESLQKIHDVYTRGEFDVQESTFMRGLYELGFNSLYSTHGQGFYERSMMPIVNRDILLCVFCGVLVSICILIHTKSVLLTVVGLFQIVLSFPVAYAIYYFICGFTHFPLVNANAAFVVFALGADDIFVAVDKWKNVRAELANGTTKQVSIAALPSAAYAMFVTSVTTGSAFFASAISPVPAMVCFSVFCGLVVTVDYVLNILLVFPMLIICDELLMSGSQSKFVSFEKYRGEIHRKEPRVSLVSTTCRTLPVELDEEIDTAPSGRESSKEDHIFIHWVLEYYYSMIHKFRWPLLVLSMAALCCCSYIASFMKPTDVVDTPFFGANHPLEIHRQMSKQLLPNLVSGSLSSRLFVVYGVMPADTGDHLDPDSFSSLVLDESFNPRPEDVQTYLLDACDRIFRDDFAKENGGNSCVMKSFNEWLRKESISRIPSNEYHANCKGFSSVPVSHDVFNSCIIAWAKLAGAQGVLEYHGEVKIIFNEGILDSTFVSPYKEKRAEAHMIAAWDEAEHEHAPTGLNFFVSSPEAWWYDTLSNMLNSAYVSTGIAVAVAAIMIIVTSQSLLVMIYSCVAIFYVVAGATASLVGLGWTLGLFESVLFAIMVGVGCDFCLHMGHAYTIPDGDVPKEERTRFALLHMGPSILASGLTTLLTAIVMLFTKMVYFQQFALMLTMTILHSIVGSFVVFLVICDCFGPSDPKKFYKLITKGVKKKFP